MDKFRTFVDMPDFPAVDVLAVTPHDTNPLANVPKRIFVGTGGNLAVKFASNTSVVYKNISNGVYLNIRPTHVLATGTTATDIIGEL